jgi:NAD(P)-dependent dehydrogenase (short-subunit alcohol dehydrogenase family)
LPVGHVGEAAEIAEAYLYLMRQSYATGQVLVVDGGAILTQLRLFEHFRAPK